MKKRQIVRKPIVRVPEDSMAKSFRIAKKITKRMSSDPQFLGTEIHRVKGTFAVRVKMKDFTGAAQLGPYEEEGILVYLCCDIKH